MCDRPNEILIEELERISRRTIFIVPLINGAPILEKCEPRTVLCTKLFKPSGHGRQTGLWMFHDEGMSPLADYGTKWVAYYSNPVIKE